MISRDHSNNNHLNVMLTLKISVFLFSYIFLYDRIFIVSLEILEQDIFEMYLKFEYSRHRQLVELSHLHEIEYVPLPRVIIGIYGYSM